MQGIYTYIPDKNYVPREYSVAAILLFLFMVHTSLAPVLNVSHFYISTFRSMCAVPNMAVFCSFLTSWIPSTLVRHFLNDFEMVPVAPIITGITFVFTLLLLLLLLCTRRRCGELKFLHLQGSRKCKYLEVGSSTPKCW